MFKKEDAFGYALFMKIILVTYYFYTTSNMLTSYAACSSMPQFFLQWKNLQDEFKRNISNKCNYKRLVKITLVLSICLAMINVMVGLFSIFRTNTIDILLTPFNISNYTPIEEKILRTAAITFGTFGNFAWALSVGMYFLICKYLYTFLQIHGYFYTNEFTQGFGSIKSWAIRTNVIVQADSPLLSQNPIFMFIRGSSLTIDFQVTL